MTKMKARVAKRKRCEFAAREGVIARLDKHAAEIGCSRTYLIEMAVWRLLNRMDHNLAENQVQRGAAQHDHERQALG